MTRTFKHLLRDHRDAQGKPFTQDSLAAALGMGRARLCQVLGNVPGRGGIMRPKVAAFIAAHFGESAEVMLQELGWDRAGNIVPQGMFQPLAGRPLGDIGGPVTSCGKPFKALQ